MISDVCNPHEDPSEPLLSYNSNGNVYMLHKIYKWTSTSPIEQSDDHHHSLSI